MDRLVAHRPAAAAVERLESRTLLAAAPPTLLRDPSAAGAFVEAAPGKTFFLESPAKLHVTNGTSGGTFLLRSFAKTAGMTAIDGGVYITTDTGVWRSDGTPAGTVHVLPMYENIDGIARAGGYTKVGDDVFFFAAPNNGVHGIFKTDGTRAGTTLVADVDAESLTAVGDTLYFIGNTTEHGHELWKSDGTAAGTVMVKDILPGFHGSMTFVGGDQAMAAVAGDKLVFKVHDGTSPYYSLWASDGTEAGTVKISATRPTRDFTVIDGVAYFGAGLTTANGLWKSDGTAAGTAEVKSLGAATAHELLDVDGTLYFTGTEGASNASLWKSDGTAAGTVRVAGPADGHPFGSIFKLTDVDGTLAFGVSDPAVQSGAYALWTSDGTTAGTVKVRDTFVGGTPGAPGQVGAAGSVALFTASDGVGAPELWGLQTDPAPVPLAVASAAFDYVVRENHTLQLHGYASTLPLPDRPLTYAWDLDNDGVFGETGAAAVHGDETGPDPVFNAAGLDGPSTHTVHLRISDPTGYADTDSADVTISNAPPTLTVSGGPATLTQGNPYTLNLGTADGGPDTITQWFIDWGDGTTQTLPGDTTSVQHNYPPGPATYGIFVTATDEDGEYRADHAAAFDATFGTNGLVTSDVSDRDDSPRGVVVQPDGKIVTISTIQMSAQSGDTTLAVNRYNPDGTLDATFGVGGRVQFRAAPFPGASAGAVALQPDGRIVVVGSVGQFASSDSVILRLLPDGSLDPTFGTGGKGYVTNNFGPYEYMFQLAVAPDGDLIAGGDADATALLARFNPDGTLDPAFGAAGKLLVDPGAARGITDLVVQPDGKILALPGASANFLLLRFNADGSPDTTFDGDGRATVDFGTGASTANSIALARDGRILIAGRTPRPPDAPQPGGHDAVVARLTPSGAIDSTFADNGRLRTAPVGPYDSSVPLQGMSGPFVRLLADGRIVLAGSHELYLNRWTFVVDRYLPDGAPDTSFGPGGRFLADVGGTGVYAFLNDMTLQPDGAALLHGGTGSSHNPVEALVRVAPPGLSVRVVDAAEPQVAITAPPTAPETQTYTLGLSATDGDGDGIEQWIVNWGDGAVQVVDGNPSSLTHVYADGPRAVVVKASAIDGDGSIASTSASVNVTNVPPTITRGSETATVAEGAAYTISFSATDPGPDTITGWSIAWGDGKSNFYPAGATSAQHVYLDDGAYAVVVSAIDEDDVHDAAPLNVTVTNVAPTIDPLPPRVAAAGANFEFSTTVRDVVPEIFSGTIDWGDGSEPTPFGGGANAFASQTFTLNHTYAATGAYTITVNASDGDGGAAQRTTNVLVGDLVVRVFEDKNGNGLRDTGDVARVGERAFLDLDRDGVFDAGEPTGETDALGEVLFDDLTDTAHAARVVVPARWHLSAPAAGFVDATPGTASALATFALSQAASVTGTIYNDANANGVRDDGEAPYVVNVRARHVETGVSVGGVTGPDGVYRITGLLPGQYVIDFAGFTGRVLTEPYARRGPLITVTGAEAAFTGRDIGSYGGTGGTINGTLFRDLNGNGTYDAGEPGGLFNQVVYLDANDNGVRDADELSAVTSPNGAWSLPRLPAGTHRVRQVLPPQSSAANDPAASALVTVALAQTVGGVNLARPFDRTFYVRRSGDFIVIYNGTERGQLTAGSIAATSTTPLALTGTAGEDWFILDWAAGAPMPAGGLSVDGLAGAQDTISVLGTTAADAASFAAGSAAVGDADFTYAGVERVTFDGRGGWDDVTVSSGPSVTLDRAQALQSLTLTGDAADASVAANLAPGGPVLRTRGLSIAKGATLDLRNVGLLFDYAGPSPIGTPTGGTYDGLTGLIQSGRNGGAWDGSGIITSMPDALGDLTTLALAEAGDLLGISGDETAAWNGQAVDATTIIVKYTYGGDSNLDGKLDADDYGTIDFSVLVPGTFGYRAGDFNFDGKVDADDYGVIDFNILAQDEEL